MIEQGLVYQFYDIETSVCFLTDFINHQMTKTRIANYAGFRLRDHICVEGT